MAAQRKRSARIWLAPDDSVHGRIWVWHVRDVGPAQIGYNWCWRRSWADAVADCLDFMKQVPPLDPPP